MNYYKTDKGILVEENDDWQENPREYSEHCTTFITFLRDKVSPDKNEYDNARDFLERLFPKGWKKIDAVYKQHRFGDGNELLQVMAENKGLIVLPVWKYEHSGITYKAAVRNPFGDDWDSCMAGYICCNKTMAVNWLGLKKGSRKQDEKIISMMEEEVREYSAWANGEVYGYALMSNDMKTILEPGQDPDEPEVTQYLWGYYGDTSENGIMEEFGLTSCDYLGTGEKNTC